MPVDQRYSAMVPSHPVLAQPKKKKRGRGRREEEKETERREGGRDTRRGKEKEGGGDLEILLSFGGQALFRTKLGLGKFF